MLALQQDCFSFTILHRGIRPGSEAQGKEGRRRKGFPSARLDDKLPRRHYVPDQQRSQVKETLAATVPSRYASKLMN